MGNKEAKFDITYEGNTKSEVKRMDLAAGMEEKMREKIDMMSMADLMGSSPPTVVEKIVMAGMMGEEEDWKVNIEGITVKSAEEANEEFQNAVNGMSSMMGTLYKPPYQFNTKVLFFKTRKPSRWIRVHTMKNPLGRWLMLEKDVEGLSPIEIQIRFALPTTPTHVSEINLPAGTVMSKGSVQYHQFESHMPATAPSGAAQFRIEEPKCRKDFFEFYQRCVSKPKLLSEFSIGNT